MLGLVCRKGERLKWLDSGRTVGMWHNFLKVYLLLFILRERETDTPHTHMHKRGREDERENPKQVSHCQRRALCGAGTHEPVRS